MVGSRTSPCTKAEPLVVLFCMHRSGSSFTARLLQSLGMSLGPFALGGADESNPHGHFEALPFLTLNRELQLKAFGFADDLPADAATLRRFRETGGQWPSETAISDSQWQEGRQLIHQLVTSDPVSGFKDPRTALTWPFWQRVLQGFPGLRIVPVFLLRSPHEIAMSLFQRSHGDFCYGDALDAVAVHFRRMKAIRDEWQGEQVDLHFDPQTFTQKVPKAVELCGMKWDESELTTAYDPDCRHHRPAVIAHDAQSLFEQMGGSEHRLAEGDNLKNLMADAALREQVLRDRLARLTTVDQENGLLVQQVATLRMVEANVHDLSAKLAVAEQEISEHQQRIASYHARLCALEAEKLIWDAYRRSRGWVVLETAWQFRLWLIPRQSWRESTIRIFFLLARAIYRRVRGGMSLLRSLSSRPPGEAAIQHGQSRSSEPAALHDSGGTMGEIRTHFGNTLRGWKAWSPATQRIDSIGALAISGWKS